ncbi:MAG TPA: GNAT family N-acetyltransferase, partial [Actinopolymorphaceae bacterium]|nr:GNAT family N-acetyltransferase [Actinopolymorphaceae bacterium]
MDDTHVDEPCVDLPRVARRGRLDQRPLTMAPTIAVKPLGDDAWEHVTRILELSFGEHWPLEDQEAERLRFEPARSIGALDGPEVVGHACIYSFTMTVPGSPLGVAGVSMVGVLPTHRRRGVLTALMRHQLTSLHETGGEAVAVLTASEPAIYGRFGYGLASHVVAIEVPRSRRELRQVAGADEVSIRYADLEKSLEACGAVHEAVVPARPGMFRHDDRWRRGEIADPSGSRRGASALRAVLAERDGRTTGFAYFRTHSSWGQRGPDGTTVVERVHAVDSASYAALWQFLLDQDLMERTTHRRLAVDDPVLSLLVDFRQAQAGVRDGLWARLVDVGRALGSRTYAEAVDVVLEVRDDFCPWNAGRWHLTGDRSGASCGKVSRSPDLVIDVRDL